jgi:transcriptional regulator with XRE-family HTH domain
MELKNRLALARGFSGLSREDLAARAGLSGPDHVAKIENGDRTRPEYRTVARLARALGISAEWLGEGIGDTPDPEAVRAAVETARAAHDAARDADAGEVAA